MFQYIAFIWNADSPEQSKRLESLSSRLDQCSRPWQEVLSGGGLSVYCRGTRSSTGVVVLPDAAGVILGTIFEKPQGGDSGVFYRRTALDADEVKIITSSECRALTSRYWGRYVAFLAAPTALTKYVVRAPLGGLPCFHAVIDGISTFFSEIVGCLDVVGPSEFSVNWNYIRRRVAIGPFRTEETALRGITEVHGGYCFRFTRQTVSRRLLWNPFDISANCPLEDPLIASRELRNAVIGCTHAWASCYPHVLHRLSGGLDSSIVAVSLKGTPNASRVTCINYHVDGVDPSDERNYARLAARAGGHELIERDRSLHRPDLRQLLAFPRSVTPHPYIGNLENLSFERSLASSRGAGAILSGDPGDSLFCRFRLDLAVADFVAKCGVRGALFKLAEQVAQIEGLSIWSILWNSLSYGRCDAKSMLVNPASPSTRPLASEELCRAVGIASRYEVDPWLSQRANVSPGKLLQIMTLSCFAEPFYPLGWEDDDPEEVCPLGSQPVVELCLRIPTYTHCYRGLSRGLARFAFESDLAPEVLYRLWKGRPGRRSKDLVASNIQFARELLLDGILVRERLIDRAAVEDALSGQPTQLDCHALHVFEHLLTEVWLRSWWTQRDRLAA